MPTLLAQDTYAAGQHTSHARRLGPGNLRVLVARPATWPQRETDHPLQVRIFADGKYVIGSRFRGGDRPDRSPMHFERADPNVDEPPRAMATRPMTTFLRRAALVSVVIDCDASMETGVVAEVR